MILITNQDIMIATVVVMTNDSADVRGASHSAG
ncbi:MAG: hypothetical protein KatS3mg023_4050 [Armatimonadota bacterium]|nr:MAG: hypothetical protein KatS3mg023_4050 [Armatimonadota bacterium]